MIYSVVFAIATGLGMIGYWILSYQTKQIPEIESEPFRIWFHIAAEMLTALVLIVSAVGLLVNPILGRSAYLVALGMLFYTAIVSSGYFAQKGKWEWVVIFAVLIALGFVGLLQMI
jgi:uncharacterized membrane protein